MRIAAIDIGTNSIHMIVVQVRPDLSFEVIDREKEMVRLGAGGLDGRALTPEAMHAGAPGAVEVQAAGRIAPGRRDHRRRDQRHARSRERRRIPAGGHAEQTGIRPRVISGTEEARLIHLAAVYGVSVPGDVAVVIDIGGGSVEITRGTGPVVELGTQLQARRHPPHRAVRQDRPARARATNGKLVRHIDAEIGKYLNQIAHAGFDRVIGTSGTILSLGAVAAAADGRAPARRFATAAIPAKQIRRVRKELVALRSRGAAARPGPRTAARRPRGRRRRSCSTSCCGGSAPTEITLCDLSLREGLVLDYIARAPQANRAGRSLSGRPPPQRVSSWPSAATTGRSTRSRSRGSPLGLFDQTRAIHGLTDREREWLEYAAILHDIGVHISYEGHHKHSLLPDQERRPARLRARRDRDHRARRALSPAGDAQAQARRLRATCRPDARRTVRTLAAILRLAESLDRSHAQTITGVELHDRGDDDLLQAAHDRRRRAGALGGGASRRAVRTPDSASRSARSRADIAYAEQPDATARVPGQAVRRRGDRRLGQDDAAGAAGEVAERRRASRVRHRMELVRPGQGGDEDGQKEKRADPDDVQPAARHGLR